MHKRINFIRPNCLLRLNWGACFTGVRSIADESNFKKPRHYWDDFANQRAFMDGIAQKYQIDTPKNWKKVTKNQIKQEGGSRLLSKYKSFERLLKAIYPEFDWESKELQRKRKGSSYWSTVENQRLFLEKLAQQLNVKSPKDWLKVPRKCIIENGGSRLIAKYSTYHELLETIYPEIAWNVFEDYRKVPRKYWDTLENQRKFMDYISKKLNITSQEDWKDVTRQKLEKLGGSGLLGKYSSFFALLRATYPEYNWNEFESRKQVPFNYWVLKENQKKYLDSIKEKYNIKSNVQWKSKLIINEIRKNASGMLAHYPTFYDCLKENYPEEDWSNFISKKYSKDYWSDSNNIIQFRDRLCKHFAINDVNDWYRLSQEQIVSQGGRHLLTKYGFIGMLKTFYPGFDWDIKLLKNAKKKSTQRLLFTQVKKLFANYEIIEEFKHDLLTRVSGFTIEFDIYLPDIPIAFEYHGEHHYFDVAQFGPIEMYQTRDREKKKLSTEFNIPLIIVPYWWDGSIELLRKEIIEQGAGEILISADKQ